MIRYVNTSRQINVDGRWHDAGIETVAKASDGWSPVMRACQRVMFCSSTRTKTEEVGLRGRSMLRLAISLPTRTRRPRGCAPSPAALFAYL